MDGVHVKISSYYLPFDHLKLDVVFWAEEHVYDLPGRFIITPVYPSNVSLELSVMELRFTDPNPQNQHFPWQGLETEGFVQKITINQYLPYTYHCDNERIYPLSNSTANLFQTVRWQ